jgi:OmpA-OmpF porin, OOP family
MLRSSLTLLVSLALSTPCFAQEDVPGCKDHPMFNRMPNTFIQECTQNFDQVAIPVSMEPAKPLEGTKTFIEYVYNTESGVPAPSFLQIVKNYENAIAKYRGRRVYYSKEAGVASLTFRSDGKVHWIMLDDRSGAVEGNYIFTLLEMEAMKQDISANGILDGLNATGSVALYINFETGKSVIVEESQSIVGEIAKMLIDNPLINIVVEGHTDNVGSAAANQKLSSDRATSVMNALVKAGIAKTRLQSKGWGQDKPLEPNSTEEGRARNRRVEIVKVS